MKRWMICVVAALTAAVAASGMSVTGWRPKFYDGLEAVGTVGEVPKGYDGESACMQLKHVSGALKFGAEADVKSEVPGRVRWTVKARVRTEDPGEVAAAMEFYGKGGRSLGEKTAKAAKATTWTLQEWSFLAPKGAETAKLRILTTAGGTVKFARVEAVASAAGDEDDVALEAKALPARPNRDWTGLDHETFTSFAGAPMPLSFHFRGDRAQLKAPAFELDVPEELEFRDAFLMHPFSYRAETPTARTAFERDGKRYVRLRFERLAVFNMIFPQYAWERKLTVYLSSARTGSHDVYYRTSDGTLRGAETRIRMTYERLPEGLRKPKKFPIFSWGHHDLLVSRDEVMNETAAAYEAAGLTVAPWPAECARSHELRALLKKRETGWRFPKCLTDYYDREAYENLGGELKALGAPSRVDDSGKESPRHLCPEFFRSDARLGELLKRSIAKTLAAHRIEKGEWVALDVEPWGSSHWCTCPLCLEAFRKEAGLAEAPKPGEQCRGALKEKWIEFRLGQTEDATRLTCEAIRAFDPSLRIVDYDYVVEYGAPDEKVLYGGCAKSAERNEKWFDVHQSSYYHILGEKVFRMMRNNTRHLKKACMPVVAIDGAGGYLSAKEVRTPRQVMQFALAAAVNGCPGMAVYSGRHYDGAFLKAFAQARDAIAAIEDFPWGRTDGALAAAADDPDFRSATTAAGGKELIALFNYNGSAKTTAKVTHPNGGTWRIVNAVSGRTLAARADLTDGFAVDVPAEGVRVLEIEREKE